MAYRDYYAEISSLDEAMGELRDELKETFTYENTLLWYCGDNGGVDTLSVTGGRGHKGQLYEGGLLVPSILEWPAKIKAPLKTTKPLTTMDIFPTILEVTNTDWDESRPIDGNSLMPLLTSDDQWPKRKIGFWTYADGIETPESEFMHTMLREQNGDMELEPYDIQEGHELHLFKNEPLDPKRGHAVWLDWPWKLHRIKKWQQPRRLELYNLEKDPMEEQNLANTDTLRLRRMLSEMKKWQISVSLSATGKDY
jgi:hypothetical protein